MVDQPERKLAEYHESRWNLAFWLKSIFTLGIWYFFVHRFNFIELTTRRLTQHRGNALAKNETSMSVTNITDITVNQSVLGNIFNYGDISVSSAGSSGAEISAKRLTNAARLRDVIYDLRDGKLDESKL